MKNKTKLLGSFSLLAEGCNLSIKVAFIALFVFLLLGFGGSVSAADYEFTIEHQEIERFYLVHVPFSYNKEEKTPIVLAFHGRYSNGKQMKEYYHLVEKSNEKGFIVIFPTGASRFGDKLASWNVGGCCGYAYEINSDDVGFVKKILEDTKNKFNIDESRVYATGMSNGARFSYRLACEMSDIFAAIAVVAGVKSTGSCNPSKRIPILHIHAIDDELIPFEGGPGPEGVDYGSVSDTIDWWVEKNQCTDEKIRVLEVDGAYCDSYSNCAGNSEVELCVTEEGGHSWPGGQKLRLKADTPSTAIDATEVIWEFFENHPMSQADLTSPSRSNPQPTGALTSGTTSTNIFLATNETAECKYSTVANISYDDMSNIFAATDSTDHSTNVTNLEDGNSYTYHVRCQDKAGNVNDTDFEISFSIASHTIYSLSNFISLVSDWLKSEIGLTSDVNNDGVVNTRDLGIMMSNWQN